MNDSYRRLPVAVAEEVIMSVTVFTIIVVLVLAASLFVPRAFAGVRTYLQLRGRHLVMCPETHKTEAVDVAAGEAGLGKFFSEPTLRLKRCSRWPERQDCGQDCLHEIEADSQNCLVWNIVAKWYEGKKCIFCSKPFAPLNQWDHAPALLGQSFRTTEWRDMRPEELPQIFATHQPVCWNCHVAETFRRLHPELVTDRAYEWRRTM